MPDLANAGNVGPSPRFPSFSMCQLDNAGKLSRRRRFPAFSRSPRRDLQVDRPAPQSTVKASPTPRPPSASAINASTSPTPEPTVLAL